MLLQRCVRVWGSSWRSGRKGTRRLPLLMKRSAGLLSVVHECVVLLTIWDPTSHTHGLGHDLLARLLLDATGLRSTRRLNQATKKRRRAGGRRTGIIAETMAWVMGVTGHPIVCIV